MELTPPENAVAAPATVPSIAPQTKTQAFTSLNTTSVDELISRAAEELMQESEAQSSQSDQGTTTGSQSTTGVQSSTAALPDSTSPVQLEEPNLDVLLSEDTQVPAEKTEPITENTTSTAENAPLVVTDAALEANDSATEKTAKETTKESAETPAETTEVAMEQVEQAEQTKQTEKATETGSTSKESSYADYMKKRNLAQMQAKKEAEEAAKKEAAEKVATEKNASENASEKTSEAATEKQTSESEIAAAEDPDADLLPDANEDEEEVASEVQTPKSETVAEVNATAEPKTKETEPKASVAEPKAQNVADSSVKTTAKADTKPAKELAAKEPATKAQLANETKPTIAKQAPTVGAKVEDAPTLDSLMTGESVKKLAKTLAEEENTLRENAIVRAIRSVRPAVVNIRGEKTIKSSTPSTMGEDTQRVNGMGTGILIDSRGYILTNYHVVDGISEIQVTTEDSRKYEATVLERDAETDLAIIRIMPQNGEAFETIRLGHSQDLLTGETVIAVGNAFGYEHTVTTGIISAQHRAVQVSDVQFYNDLIQTDASINPGNSGGPLLNIRGEMIGVNVAVRAGAQGIGFAIPVDKALEVAARMVSHYASQHFWHGLQLAFEEHGAKVVSVEKDSPAQNAGLRAGDLVCAVNNNRIRSEMDFVQAVLEQKAGDTLELKIVRGSKKARTELTLGSVRTSSMDTQLAQTAPRSATYNAPVASNSTKAEVEARIWDQIGVEVLPVSANVLEPKLAQSYKGGLQVQKVRPESPAAKQGVRSGDVLLGVMRWETLSVSNLLFVMEQSEYQNAPKAKFLIGRGNVVMFGYLGKQ